MYGYRVRRRSFSGTLAEAVVILCLSGTQPLSAETPLCTRRSAENTVCRLNVSTVRPTQFAVGMVAVRCRQARMEKKSPAELRHWLGKKKRRVPTVIGPDGNFYITDRQHLAAALLHSRFNAAQKQLVLRIDYNLYARPEPRLGMSEFWRNMQGESVPGGMNDGIQRVWLYDVHGNPSSPANLPVRIADLVNDSFRTLSRWVRDACGYIKSGKRHCRKIRRQPASPYYLEFFWADYLRRTVPLIPPVEDTATCRARPYSRACLADEISFLLDSFDVALAAAGSESARDYLLRRDLNPEFYGFNNSGRRAPLKISAQGCEIKS